MRVFHSTRRREVVGDDVVSSDGSDDAADTFVTNAEKGMERIGIPESEPEN